jgi:hypothetical protein
MNCLMIETKDKRKFFTHEKNFGQLIEFSKTFGAPISLVKIKTGPVLELEELAPAICDANYQKPRINYQLLETKLSTNYRTRPNIIKAASKIKQYIVTKFKTDEVVSLKDLKNKFKRCQLSDTALCNHIRRVKDEMQKKGYTFIKVGGGKYQLNQKP